MANLNRIPIRYFEKTDEYNFVVDNRPLRDLANQIVAINNDIISLQNSLSQAAGSQSNLKQRLDESLNEDGSIKPDAIPGHPLENHTDGNGYVRMTEEERVKLSGISPSANNLSMRFNDSSTVNSGEVVLRDSASVKILNDGLEAKLYSVVPTSYYHKHYGPLEPLVKCRYEGGDYIADEDASPAYYVKAISTYKINESNNVYPEYFYTNDGVPSGSNDGTPVPFSNGSLEISVNGVETPVEYTALDTEAGRFKISDEASYSPKYVAPDDFDIFRVSWVKKFDPETESLGPTSAPRWSSESFGSGSTLTVRETSPETMTVFPLSQAPAGNPNDWSSPTDWIDTFSFLSVPTGIFSENGSIAPWNNNTDPQSGQEGWIIIRQDNGSSFDYYLAWLEPSSPNYPVNIFYQCEAL